MRVVNLIIGILQSLLNILLIVPYTIKMFTVQTEFGFELLLLPILLPFCFFLFFGLSSVFGFFKKYGLSKKLVRFGHISVIISTVISLCFAPFFWFMLLLIPISGLCLMLDSKKEVFFMNIIALIAQTTFLVLAINP